MFKSIAVVLLIFFMTKRQGLGTARDLRDLYDGDHDRFVEEATGKSADEIRAMSFDDRQRLLAVIGVNVPNQKPENGTQRG